MRWKLELERKSPGCDSSRVKTVSIEEAQAHLKTVCEEALGGEEVRLKMANGTLLALAPLPAAPAVLSDEQLAKCYDDNEWAEFENHCAAAND